MGNDAGIIWLIGLAIIIALVNFIKEYWVAFAVLAIILLALFFWAGSGKSSATAEAQPIDNLRIQNLVRVFSESADIVETSANIETVDSRYGVMVEVGKELVAIPSAELDNFRREFYTLDAAEIFNAAAERYIERQLYEISALKTERGRNNRAAKIEAIIDGLTNMPMSSKNYAKNLLRLRM